MEVASGDLVLILVWMLGNVVSAPAEDAWMLQSILRAALKIAMWGCQQRVAEVGCSTLPIQTMRVSWFSNMCVRKVYLVACCGAAPNRVAFVCSVVSLHSITNGNKTASCGGASHNNHLVSTAISTRSRIDTAAW